MPDENDNNKQENNQPEPDVVDFMIEQYDIQIAKLEAKLDMLRGSRTDLLRRASSNKRFAKCGGQMEAVLKLLYEDGGPQTVKTIIAVVVAGGGTIGNLRPPSAMKQGMNSGIKAGFLTKSREGDLDDDVQIDITEKGREEYLERKLNEV